MALGGKGLEGGTVARLDGMIAAADAEATRRGLTRRTADQKPAKPARQPWSQRHLDPATGQPRFGLGSKPYERPRLPAWAAHHQALFDRDNQ